MPGSPRLPFRHGAAHIGAIYKKIGRSGPLPADVVQAVQEYQTALRELAEITRRRRGRTPVEREELRDALAAAIQRKSAALAALDGVLVDEE